MAPGPGSGPTPEQAAAITAGPQGAFLVAAGPGTGKTFTMVERFLWLVTAHRTAPDRIFTVTFTDRAATELRERIGHVLQRLGRAQAVETMDQAWIGTFHSLCGRILRENAYRIGVPREMRVLDTIEQALLVRELQGALRSGSMGDIDLDRLEALGLDEVSDLIRHGLQFVRKLKGRGITPAEFRSRALDLHRNHIHPADGDDLAARAEEEAIDILFTLYDLYQSRLRESGWQDFDDLLLGTVTALREVPELRAWCRDRFPYLLVDEFQDSNRLQMDLLELLAAPNFANVTVVGDAKQSIYGWRDADVENIRRRFPGRALPLTRNRRSRQEILDCATSLIRRDPQFASEPELVAERGRGGSQAVTVLMAHDAAEEARLVGKRIAALHALGLAYAQMAVLSYTITRLPPEFEHELRLRRIPYVTSAGAGLFDREEVKDVLGMLRLVDDPMDDGALSRVLSGPLVRMDDPTLYRLALRRLDDRGSRLRDWLDFDGLAPDVREKALRTLGTLDRLGDSGDAMSVSDLLNRVLDETGYLRHCELRAREEGPRAVLNLRKIALMASEYERDRSLATLGDFVEHLDQVFDSELGLAEAAEPAADAVSLLTIHAAKGLEFDVVFLVNTRPPLVRDSERLFFDPEGTGFVMKTWRGEKHPRYIETNPSTGALQLAREERRRGVYVALTRARDQVFVSASRQEASPEEIEVRTEADDHFSEIVSWARANPEAAVVVWGEQLDLPVAVPDSGSRLETSADVTPILERLRLIARSGRQPGPPPRAEVRLSFSQLHSFEVCPIRYRFQEVLGIPAPPDELGPRPRGRGGESLGTAIHEALSAWHEGEGPDLPSQFATTADLHGLTEREIAEGSEMLRRYESLPIARAQTLGTEVEFNLQLDHVRVRGIVDRIAQDDKGTVLVDFKTNHRLESAVLAAYTAQLQLYGLAAEQGILPGERMPRLLLIHLRAARAHEVPLNSAAAAARIKRAADRILAGDFELGPENADRPCRTCAYLRICPHAR